MIRNDYPFLSAGPYPPRPGNDVRLLVDGEPAFRRICEAIEEAKRCVWVTVTFMWPEFRMPDGRGTALEVLARAARRGVDVRVLGWRPDDETASWRRNAFWGSEEHIELLEQANAPLLVRWDRAQPGYCQHQKAWLIDAGEEDATAFVGGINMNPHSVVAPGHVGVGQNHDVYVEVSGPSVADVQHNFVQRWNESSERDMLDGGWGDGWQEALRYPSARPPERGNVLVQMQRTVHVGRHREGRPAVGASEFDAWAGETTIFDQYLLALRSAKRTVYMENQYLEVSQIVEGLRDALGRGVLVTLVMPVTPDVSPSASVERKAFFQARASLGGFENFQLCGIAGVGPGGDRAPVYVHSKLMLVDDEWATVGSANLHRFSLFGNAEMNAAIYSPTAVRSFRVELFGEHLSLDTSHLDDVAASKLFHRVATENDESRRCGDNDWKGLAFALDVATYGLTRPD